MLYERWREVAREFRGELAVRDIARKQHFTFEQIDRASESDANDSPILFPQGHTAEFFISVLRGWRKGRVICPLELNQPVPVLRQLPPGGAHLKMTSASTGPARMVALTAEQLVADARNIVATMKLRRDWPNLAVISLAHSYGFSNLVTPLLLHGIPVILAGPPLPEIVREAAAFEPAITLPAVPALWRTWLDADAIPPQTKLAISAGAPLPLELERQIFAQHGIKVHNFYGASECGGIAYDETQAPRTDLACVGRPMENVRLSLNEKGCLRVQSRAVAQTYWPESDETLRDGTFETSDLAEIQDGQIFLRGRVGDQINVAGRKVSPESIERVLMTHPSVQECVVFGCDSEESSRGEMVVACVVFRGETDFNSLRQFLLTRLPSWQVPREWMRAESIEANARGKISRAEWRRKFLASR